MWPDARSKCVALRSFRTEPLFLQIHQRDEKGDAYDACDHGDSHEGHHVVAEILAMPCPRKPGPDPGPDGPSYRHEDRGQRPYGQSQGESRQRLAQSVGRGQRTQECPLHQEGSEAEVDERIGGAPGWEGQHQSEGFTDQDDGGEPLGAPENGHRVTKQKRGGAPALLSIARSCHSSVSACPAGAASA